MNTDKKESREVRAAKAIAGMCRSSSNFDEAFTTAMEKIRPLARQRHSALRYKYHVLIPLNEALGDTKIAERVLEAITRNPDAVRIINALHKDSVIAEAEAAMAAQEVMTDATTTQEEGDSTEATV